MIEITDEMVEAAYSAGVTPTDEGPDYDVAAIIAAVAPLIVAQVREQMAEDRMAGEILRGAIDGKWGIDDCPMAWKGDRTKRGLEVWPAPKGEPIRADTVAAIYQKMVEAGMIGKEK